MFKTVYEKNNRMSSFRVHIMTGLIIKQSFVYIAGKIFIDKRIHI